ncbi:hypothetical protein CTE05_17450 [Cellulomonas terrae]|uniref:PH domain-containing protein n=1 Tax=Cellulomonas terrae TaxID=311234 RepID=A0A511JJL1_9CELL|nr:hypothetical protein CTE05_17450 [Cellulomonas terrae]
MTGSDDDELERWLDAYEQAAALPGRAARLSCPTCGVQALRLEFVSFSHGGEAVMPAFWCDSCRRGLPPVRAYPPAWATPVRWEETALPDYDLVGVPTRPQESS